MHECGDGLRHRNSLHRGCLSGDPVRRCGYHAWLEELRELHLPHRGSRIYEPHGFEHEPESPSRFDSL